MRLLLALKLLRWSALVIVLVFGIHLVINRRKPKQNNKNKSLIDSFVFLDKIKDRTTLIQKYNAIFENSLLLTDNDKVDFVHFRPIQDSIKHVKQQTFPNPRSHVVTNSSHVIWKFVHEKGCVFNKRHGVIYQYLKVVFVCYESVNNITGLKCRSWTWDPANWTLTLSNNKEVANVFGQYRVCAYPKLTDRVSKVIYPNGSEEYRGCAFNKSPCAVVEPYFDVDLRMRINWSPCCRRMMIRMLSNTHDIFEKHRIRYVMTGGAVISVGRENGTLIPYDTDLDLIVDIRDRAKFSNQSAADMADLGYYYIWNKKGNYIKICQNKVCDAHIDVWFYERYPGDRHMVKYFKMRFWSLRETILFPTSWQYFEGKKYRFPRKIIKYLDHEYSTGLMAGYRNWKTVLLCNHKRGRKCTFYSDKNN